MSQTLEIGVYVIRAPYHLASTGILIIKHFPSSITNVSATLDAMSLCLLLLFLLESFN